MHEKTSSESLHEEVPRIDRRNMSEIGGKRDGKNADVTRIFTWYRGYLLGI